MVMVEFMLERYINSYLAILKEKYSNKSPFLFKGNILLYGAGGVGNVWFEKLIKNGNNVVGFIDDKKRGIFKGLQIFDSKEIFLKLKNNYNFKIFITIGDYFISEKLKENLKNRYNVEIEIVNPPFTFSRDFYYYSLLEKNYNFIKNRFIKSPISDEISLKTLGLTVAGLIFLFEFFNEKNSDYFLFEEIISILFNKIYSNNKINFFEYPEKEIEFNKYKNILFWGTSTGKEVKDFLLSNAESRATIVEKFNLDLINYNLKVVKNNCRIFSDINKVIDDLTNFDFLKIDLNYNEWNNYNGLILDMLQQYNNDFVLNVTLDLEKIFNLILKNKKRFKIYLLNNEYNIITGLKVFGKKI